MKCILGNITINVALFAEAVALVVVRIVMPQHEARLCAVLRNNLNNKQHSYSGGGADSLVEMACWLNCVGRNDNGNWNAESGFRLCVFGCRATGWHYNDMECNEDQHASDTNGRILLLGGMKSNCIGSMLLVR